MSDPSISPDGYWKFIDGEWTATEKQISALEKGAIPHDFVEISKRNPEIFQITSLRLKQIALNSRNKCGEFSLVLKNKYSNLQRDQKLQLLTGVGAVSVTLIVILIIASLSIVMNNQTPPLNCSSENRDDRDDTCPIEIASWNLNRFGRSSAENDTIRGEMAEKISNYDIIAMLSAGISFKRFIVPHMVAATLLAGTSFYLNHWLIPRANSTRIDFEENYLRYKFHNVNRDIHKQIAPDVFIYFESFNSARQIGYKVSIEEWEDGALKKKLLADFARWDSTKEIWSIQNYAIREFNNGQEKLRKGIRLDTLLSFTPDDFSKRKFISIQMMNYNELNAFIDEEKKKGNDKVPIYEIEKHTRTSLPLATYILTLMGVSVSSRKIRGGIGVHLALGLLLAVSYILFMKISSVYATNTGIDPLFATWIPNIVYAVIAIVLFKRAHK